MKKSVRIIGAKTNAIRIIHGEHRSIAAVLSGMGELARTLQDPAVQPGFAVLHAMIRYIDAFPERQHHPKEEAFLFTPIVMRTSLAGTLVDALRGEHDEGARLIQELRQALLSARVKPIAGRAGVRHGDQGIRAVPLEPHVQRRARTAASCRALFHAG